MRKENNKEAIDPENFIMPDDRLLSAKEAKLLEAKGVVIKWVKCKFCGSLGATSDDRECCNFFDEDWDGDELEAMTIYPKLKSKFESLNDDELDGYFEQFAWEERTIDELMFLDKDARSNLLENLN